MKVFVSWFLWCLRRRRCSAFDQRSWDKAEITGENRLEVVVTIVSHVMLYDSLLG